MQLQFSSCFTLHLIHCVILGGILVNLEMTGENVTNEPECVMKCVHELKYLVEQLAEHTLI